MQQEIDTNFFRAMSVNDRLRHIYNEAMKTLKSETKKDGTLNLSGKRCKAGEKLIITLKKNCRLKPYNLEKQTFSTTEKLPIITIKNNLQFVRKLINNDENLVGDDNKVLRKFLFNYFLPSNPTKGLKFYHDEKAWGYKDYKNDTHVMMYKSDEFGNIVNIETGEIVDNEIKELKDYDLKVVNNKQADSIVIEEETVNKLYDNCISVLKGEKKFGVKNYKYDILIALITLSGRRTIEVLISGRVRNLEDKNSPLYANHVLFKGQAKTRNAEQSVGDSEFLIPVVCDSELFVNAWNSNQCELVKEELIHSILKSIYKKEHKAEASKLNKIDLDRKVREIYDSYKLDTLDGRKALMTKVNSFWSVYTGIMKSVRRTLKAFLFYRNLNVKGYDLIKHALDNNLNAQDYYKQVMAKKVYLLEEAMHLASLKDLRALYGAYSYKKIEFNEELIDGFSKYYSDKEGKIYGSVKEDLYLAIILGHSKSKVNVVNTGSVDNYKLYKIKPKTAE